MMTTNMGAVMLTVEVRRAPDEPRALKFGLLEAVEGLIRDAGRPMTLDELVPRVFALVASDSKTPRVTLSAALNGRGLRSGRFVRVAPATYDLTPQS